MMASASFSLEEMIIWPEEVSGKYFPAQERLNHLMVLHIHKEMTDSLDIKSVINAILFIVQSFLQKIALSFYFKQYELHYLFECSYGTFN